MNPISTENVTLVCQSQHVLEEQSLLLIERLNCAGTVQCTAFPKLLSHTGMTTFRIQYYTKSLLHSDSLDGLQISSLESYADHVHAWMLTRH